jgi:ABC-type branched-subunit amino acid transport system substrate-binding protein
MGGAMVDYAADVLKAKRVGILVDDGLASKEIDPPMRRRIEERGLTLAQAQQYHFRTPDMTPELLSLRRSNPEVLLVYTASFEDTATLVKTLGDINWDVPVAGGITVAVFAAPVAKQVGARAFDKVVATLNLGFTACSSDPIGAPEFAKLLEKVKAFAPDQYDKMPKTTAALGYDAVHIVKAAVEATGSLEGPKLATWLEQNAAQVKAITGPLSASKSRHHFFDSKATAIIVHPDQLRPDGLAQRAGC